MTRITNSHGTGIALPNGTGIQVRTKAEDLLACLFTLNQGSGTLTTAQGLAAYVPFIDGNTLKIQNAANNGQVTLGDVSLTNFGHANLAASNTFAAATIFNEDVTFTGASANILFDKSTDDLIFNDNAKAIFGTSSDGLEIFHDTSGTEQSVIKDSGTGQLLIQGENTIAFTNVAGNENYLRMIKDESVELFENGVKKFETAPGGVALTGGAAANIVTVPSSSNTVTLDMATACHFVIGAGTPVVLGENTTFAAPTNQAVGQAGSIFIKQDSTGSRTVAFNTAFKFVGGTVPTMSTAGGAVDRVDYIVFASGDIHCAVSLDVKR